MNKIKYLFLMVMCAGIFGTINVSAQTGGDSQRQANVDKVIEFYEWAFETKFTNSERSRMQAIKEEGFQKDPAGEKKGIAATIANFAAVRTKNENEQAKVRAIFVPDFIGQLQSVSNDDEAKLLLSVYERVQSVIEAEADSNGAGDISSLAGKWAWTRTGGGEINRTTGAWMGGNGSRFTYEFSSNGTVKFTGIMNVMQGGCSQQVFRTIEGKASLSGDNLTIRWSPEKFTRDFSCDSANNYTKTMPAKTEKLKVSFKNSSGQKQLCILGDNCYSPTN